MCIGLISNWKFNQDLGGVAEPPNIASAFTRSILSLYIFISLFFYRFKFIVASPLASLIIYSYYIAYTFEVYSFEKELVLYLIWSQVLFRVTDMFVLKKMKRKRRREERNDAFNDKSNNKIEINSLFFLIFFSLLSVLFFSSPFVSSN